MCIISDDPCSNFCDFGWYVTGTTSRRVIGTSCSFVEFSGTGLTTQINWSSNSYSCIGKFYAGITAG